MTVNKSYIYIGRQLDVFRGKVCSPVISIFNSAVQIRHFVVSLVCKVLFIGVLDKSRSENTKNREFLFTNRKHCNKT